MHSVFKSNTLLRKYRKQLLTLAFFCSLGLLWRWASPFKSLFRLLFLKKALVSKKPQRKALSISLNKIILWNPSRDPEVPNYAFIESVVPILSILCERFDVYLIATVKSLKEKKQIEELIYSSPLARKHQLDVRKILFCQTALGRSHIVRHISPYLHVDNDIEVANQLKQFVPQIVLIWSKKRSEEKLSKHSSASEFQLPKNIEIYHSFLDSRLA
ncbi:hypothetical protein DSO57_1018378 [Entomophthora muscae]|uniref:Uncharacterized protein n=1 Tax=Entomophthora muscae TaxID=34485 RepID=A0ACC2T466_9FUNG|nr:hypothetical protein DSO57_1018378 [Entomophthora muscae]